MRLRNTRTAKQNVIGGLLVFTILISVSLVLGLYGYYTERTSRTTTKPTTNLTTTPPTNTTATLTTTPTNTTNTVTTTPTNTTAELPYVPE